MNGVQKGIKIVAICFAIFLIVNIFGWIIFGLSFFINLQEYNDKKTSERSEVSYTFEEQELKDIDRISIDINASALTIKEGEKFKVETEESENSVTVKVMNGTLKIEEKSRWFFNHKNIENIIVYVPENIKLEDLEINAGAGKIEISNIHTEKFDMDHGAGKLDITDCIFNKVDIDGGAGEIIILSSELNDLSLDAGVGRVEINGKITGKSEIECGIGELDVSIKGNKEDYKIMAQKGIGSIKIDGAEQGNDTIFGNGENVIRLEGGIRKCESGIY